MAHHLWPGLKADTHPRGSRCESELTRAGRLYLFCTYTVAFYRFSPIEPIE
jgi:hypothetical protein